VEINFFPATSASFCHGSSSQSWSLHAHIQPNCTEKHKSKHTHTHTQGKKEEQARADPQTLIQL
jgi:hypothetical protein